MLTIVKPKIKKVKNYTQPGKSLSTGEFSAMVRDAEESGYMTPDEFKKKCQELLNTK